MISLVMAVIGLLVALTIFLLIRRDILNVKHGLGWLMAAGLFTCLGFAPSFIDHISVYFGINYPPALALTLTVIALILKLLIMDIERSRTEIRVQRLTQRLAMLEAKAAPPNTPNSQETNDP